MRLNPLFLLMTLVLALLASLPFVIRHVEQGGYRRKIVDSSAVVLDEMPEVSIVDGVEHVTYHEGAVITLEIK